MNAQKNKGISQPTAKTMTVFERHINLGPYERVLSSKDVTTLAQVNKKHESLSNRRKDKADR